MPPEVTEVEVIVTGEPSNQEQTEDNPNQSQSTEMTVGELKAKVESLEKEVQELKNKDNQLESLVEDVSQIHRWNREEIEEIASSLFQRMNQIEENLQQIESDDLTESESESSGVNNEEIPVVPEPMEQQEPEEVSETKRRRPWFL